MIEVVQLEGRVNEFVSAELGYRVGPRLRELAPPSRESQEAEFRIHATYGPIL